MDADMDLERSRIESLVSAAIGPVMEEHEIPGMAVGVTLRGQRYLFTYGVASIESGQAVAEDTLFEIGSISKTFTATLAAYAEARGALSLSDSASSHLPALAGSSFDTISLRDLGTYTAGGLPLQFPDAVGNQEAMIAYFRSWRPAYAPGSHRLYSNPSLGLFGYLAAASLGKPFSDIMEQKLLPALGLTETYVQVPPDRMGRYAPGYTKGGAPIRVAPGLLDTETYGLKTTAGDLLRFLELNMNPEGLEESLRRALARTQAGYERVGPMTQGLGWEFYAYPTELAALLAGNSVQVIREVRAVERLDPPLPPQKAALFNKTGSTNGFGAYILFVPAKEIGIVLLANRNYPIPERVTAAHRILTALEKR